MVEGKDNLSYSTLSVLVSYSIPSHPGKLYILNKIKIYHFYFALYVDTELNLATCFGYQDVSRHQQRHVMVSSSVFAFSSISAIAMKLGRNKAFYEPVKIDRLISGCINIILKGEQRHKHHTDSVLLIISLKSAAMNRTFYTYDRRMMADYTP